MVSYINLLLFFSTVLVFAVGTLILAKLIRYRDPVLDPVKTEPYECGEVPVGDAWVRFSVSFYLIALVFVLFDVEVAFLFPWVLSLSKLGLFAFIEMVVFLSILFLGWLYAFKKGDLRWERL
ncbi:MAG TPA: NADH-quinone oxidoreductase subunit A [Thermodesulfobacteriota bacterium]|nr:NADH-quinone oxidoreductase subunit A [Thermodesulfobacteriota bacterium]